MYINTYIHTLHTYTHTGDFFGKIALTVVKHRTAGAKSPYKYTYIHTYIHTGDFFGEIALTVVKHRTADVKSLGALSGHGPRNSGPAEPVELFQLLRTDFEAVMDRYPILKTRLAQIGQARVKRASVPVDGAPKYAGTGTHAAPASSSAAGAKTREGMCIMFSDTYACACVVIHTHVHVE
jgi:hypothetical protein